MQVTFRLAQTGDQPTLLDMMHDFYAIDGYPFDRERSRHNLQHFISDPSLGCLWIISVDRADAGYLVLAYGFSFEYGGRDAFLDELYLKETYRGRGIGGQAIDFVTQQAKGRGVQALHLEVERHNQRGNQLYRRKGFGGKERTLLTRWL